MRLLKLIFAAAVFAVLPTDAVACKCTNWNPSEWVAHSDSVFYAEVLSVGSAQRISKSEAEFTLAETKYPFAIRVIELFKGDKSAAVDLALVGPPSSCELSLKPGDRVAILLWKSQRIVGYCSAVSNPQMIDELRAASKKR